MLSKITRILSVQVFSSPFLYFLSSFELPAHVRSQFCPYLIFRSSAPLLRCAVAGKGPWRLARHGCASRTASPAAKAASPRRRSSPALCVLAFGKSKSPPLLLSPKASTKIQVPPHQNSSSIPINSPCFFHARN